MAKHRTPHNEELLCSISGNVRDILELVRQEGGVTVEACLLHLGRNSIPLGLVLFTLLSSLPLFGIPGFTTVTGIPIIVLGTQVLFGQRRMWLPKRIRKHRLHSRKLWRTMQFSLPYLRKLERMLKPRMLALSDAPMRNMLGGLFVIMGILLALPIPFINFPAGLSMFILAVGLVERDGIVISIGVICHLVLLALIWMTINSAVSFAALH